MNFAVLKQLGKQNITGVRAMSAPVSYAAAVSTSNSTLQQSQDRAQADSDPDLRAYSTSERVNANARCQQPSAGIRFKTNFRGWSSKEAENPPGNQPRDEHKPNTEKEEERVYVLTLRITESLARPMNELRERYFPKHLNRTPAHLTLFHALPHSQIVSLEESLSQISSSMRPFPVSTGKPFRMRLGIGVNVGAGYKDMKAVHERLRSQWLAFLSEQDAGGFRPHWTVMNKVEDTSKVDVDFDTVRRELSKKNHEGQGIGFDLWEYSRGSWKWANEYPFGNARNTPSKMQTPGKTGNSDS